MKTAEQINKDKYIISINGHRNEMKRIRGDIRDSRRQIKLHKAMIKQVKNTRKIDSLTK